ncbi:hypothetical protein B0T18DRAFT_445236 [Schizothecium vesticola]|uniref:Translation elongation factor IF5A C-terminal domain-containing protein n=1 Tax=Schizothecium vesticola TaxID=314040 RepID=A0AA40K8J0_9PEZI|nr:hypothetical protein B0T18DRAFT_445236 [Schizothecium vesticola]
MALICTWRPPRPQILLLQPRGSTEAPSHPRSAIQRNRTTGSAWEQTRHRGSPRSSVLPDCLGSSSRGTPGTVAPTSRAEWSELVANLDFEARVPVPFSIFPSSYRETETATTQTHTHEELKIDVPSHAGREEGQFAFQAQVEAPPRQETRIKEEVRITREDRRPGIKEEYFREERRRPQSSFTESRIEYDTNHKPHSSVIDVAEHEYRSRFQSNYSDEVPYAGTTVDVPSHRSSFKEPSHFNHTTVDAPRNVPSYKESVRVAATTVDVPAPRSSYHKDVKITRETVDAPRYAPIPKTSKMGYYDEDGHYHHSLRKGLHKLADRVLHPEGQDRVEYADAPQSRGKSAVGPAEARPNTVTIPCHHIRLGDILILQGRPCQVIRISTSAATGQHRYLGVDLFTKQLHEESSFVSNPAPSVVVQTMLGPVFKQYRVLDMQEGSIVAMTETGDVKQNLPVIDQSSLWTRLQKSFESGRGSVRVLVVSDNGREMAVDMKVVHGSRL